MATKFHIDTIRGLLSDVRGFLGHESDPDDNTVPHFGSVASLIHQTLTPDDLSDNAAQSIIKSFSDWKGELAKRATLPVRPALNAAATLLSGAGAIAPSAIPVHSLARTTRVANAVAAYPIDTNWSPIPGVPPPVPGVPMLAHRLINFPVADSYTQEYHDKNNTSIALALANSVEAAFKFGINPLKQFSSLADYSELYTKLPLSEVGAVNGPLYWLNDDVFAEQRLSGANPIAIQRPQLGSPILPPDDTFKSITGHPLSAELSAGRVFVVDYTSLFNAAGGTVLFKQKFGNPVSACFWWDADRRRLAPVSISITANAATTFFTPKSASNEWLRAKIYFQVADSNFHEMSTHLAKSHLFLEPFALATKRQLDTTHPLRILLDHHFEFMLAKNEDALENLIQPLGPVDRLLVGPLDTTLQIARDAYASWTLQKANLKAELNSRGFGITADALPHYPYRDDALLYWDAIETMVDRYVDHYYATDGVVIGDADVVEWCNDLRQNMNRTDIPAGGFQTRVDLKAALTTIIFTASAFHSAVNYPQWNDFGFVPNAPLAAFAGWPTNGLPPEVLSVLPRLGATLDQILIMQALTGFHIDRLGDYAIQLADPQARQIISDFGVQLGLVGSKIVQRNAQRFWPYIHLLPSNVLNSISI